MVTRAAPIVKSRAFADSGAPVRLFVKDLGIITKLGSDQGIALPLTEVAQELITEAHDAHGEDYDVSSGFLSLEERSGK